jgi:hypothetical protein
MRLREGAIMTEDSARYDSDEPEIAQRIRRECENVCNLLLTKNAKYGNSALNPVRIFSQADPSEGLRIRIDDKLSRLRSRHASEDEDVILDLIGYLMLLRIAERQG